jgi:hypothetical protein
MSTHELAGCEDDGGDASIYKESAGEEDISQRKRQCVTHPSRPHLTEQTLLQLEQSQPNYRLAQRNLDHWFFYIQSTIQDTFDTFREIPDRDFYPSAFEEHLSVVALSQADFQESHHSLAGSSDLFGFTARSPPPEVQVVIESKAKSTVRSTPAQPLVDPSPYTSPFSPAPPAPQPEQASVPRTDSSDSVFQGFDSSSSDEPRSLSPQSSALYPPITPITLPSHPYRRLRPRQKRQKPVDLSTVDVVSLSDS